MNANIIRKALIMLLFLATASMLRAAEVTYRIVEYNKSTAQFTLAASGMVPRGAWATFENDYGATTGNRYNQIPRNRQATLYLEGWQGCRVNSITLSMCSNNKSGEAGLTLTDGDAELFRLRPCEFASAEWFGQWVSKDLGVYVDICKHIDVPAFTADEAAITLSGGTSEGSVYVDAITINYDAPEGAELESLLGWTYEKLAKKSVLSEGDVVMIYRNGCAAADLGGIGESNYLDALPLASTADVTDSDVLRFTLGKGTADGTWTLTDQYGRTLGASGKQKLTWDDGTTDWTIALGYDGATLASTSAAYGTLRFNAPEESYARFALYTSTSLPLPFLYRRTGQRTAVVAQSLTFEADALTAALNDGHLALTPELKPAATTDKRILWESSDESVCTVNGGFVTLLSAGRSAITARTADGGAVATLVLTVTDTSGIGNVSTKTNSESTYKMLDSHHRVIIRHGNDTFATDGTRLR